MNSTTGQVHAPSPPASPAAAPVAVTEQGQTKAGEAKKKRKKGSSWCCAAPKKDIAGDAISGGSRGDRGGAHDATGADSPSDDGRTPVANLQGSSAAPQAAGGLLQSTRGGAEDESGGGGVVDASFKFDDSIQEWSSGKCPAYGPHSPAPPPNPGCAFGRAACPVHHICNLHASSSISISVSVSALLVCASAESKRLRRRRRWWRRWPWSEKNSHRNQANQPRRT